MAPVLAGFCLLAPVGRCADVGIPQVVQRARPAVVLISVEDEHGETVATGTGFFISEDGKLVTNQHVVKSASKIVAKAENGAFYAVERVLQADVQNDLAILQTSARRVPFLALGEAKEEDIGSQIVVVGNPLGLEGSVSTGVVAAVRDEFDHHVVQISAPISPGSSGSPVMNAQGEVIGVVSFTLTKGQNVNFAIASSAITQFLSKRPQVEKEKSDDADGRQPASAWGDPKFIEADRLLHEKDAVNSLKLLNDVVRRYPDRFEVRFSLARAYTLLEFRDDAIAEYRKAIKLSPDSVPSWANLSILYTVNGQYPLAKDAVERAIKIDPTDSGAWRVRGLYLLSIKQPKVAVDSLETSIKLRPEDGRAWDLLSLGYRQLGLTQKATEARSRADTLLKRVAASPAPATSLTGPAPEVSKPDCVVIGISAGDILNVRTSAAMTSASAFVLSNGERVRIVGQPVLNGKTEWVPIEFGTARGWVRSKYLKPIP